MWWLISTPMCGRASASASSSRTRGTAPSPSSTRGCGRALIERFERKHHRPPTFWFGKVCIEQGDIGNGLKVRRRRPRRRLSDVDWTPSRVRTHMTEPNATQLESLGGDDATTIIVTASSRVAVEEQFLADITAPAPHPSPSQASPPLGLVAAEPVGERAEEEVNEVPGDKTGSAAVTCRRLEVARSRWRR